MTDALILVTTSFPTTSDGKEAAGSFVFDLVCEIAKYVPVRVVAPGPSRGKENPAHDVEVHRFRAPEKPLSNLRPWRPADFLALIMVLRAGNTTTREAIAAGPTKGVLALWALPSGWWARRATAVLGLDYAVWTLGSDIWSLGRLPGVRRLLRTVLRDARACFSDGLVLADDTAKIARRRVDFLPSTRAIGAGRHLPPAKEGPFRLLFLGRWHPNKGVDLMLDALALLDDASWRRIAAVEIAGGGPMDALVRDRVAQLQGAGKPITLGGFLGKEEAEAAFARSDWVLIPSRIESIPVVFSDAMKMGRPVVAMPVGDLPRLVAGSVECGVLAESTRPDSFANALSRALRDSPARYQEGVARMSEEFSLSRIAKRVLDVFP